MRAAGAGTTRLLALSLLALTLAPLGCGRSVPGGPEGGREAGRAPARPRSPVKGLLARLDDPDPAARRGASRRLLALAEGGFLPKDAVRVLRAAARPYGAKDWAIPASLVRAAGRRPRAEVVPAVVELFPEFVPPARVEALELLARIDDRAAATAYVSLVRAEAGGGAVPDLATAALEANPHHADVFFPALLDRVGDPGLTRGVCRLCLVYLRAGGLRPADLRPFEGRFLAAAAAGRGRLLPEQRVDPGGVAWRWRPGYRRPKEEMLSLLTLLGHLPGPAAEAELRRALDDYRDPTLLAAAAVGLLRRGAEPDPAKVAEAAASPEIRSWLLVRLRELGREPLIPAELRTQAAVAESELAVWLSVQPRWRRPPDEIALARVDPVGPDRRGRLYDRYVFRFRNRGAAGWLAGRVTYPRSGSTRTGGVPWSEFARADGPPGETNE